MNIVKESTHARFPAVTLMILKIAIFGAVAAAVAVIGVAVVMVIEVIITPVTAASRMVAAAVVTSEVVSLSRFGAAVRDTHFWGALSTKVKIRVLYFPAPFLLFFFFSPTTIPPPRPVGRLHTYILLALGFLDRLC